MNKIRVSCDRGTAYMNTEPIQSKLITNTNTQSRISQDKNGLKVTCSKETSSFWITKVPKIHMAIPKIIVSNIGTKYSKCEI